MTVYCLVELDGGGVADASLRALTLARDLATGPAVPHPGAATTPGGPGGTDGGHGLAAVVFGEPPIVGLAAYGITDVYVVRGIDGYAPVAWARALAGLLDSATAVVAAGTDRGNEVLAHLGAITGLPMAANCVTAAVAPGDEASGRVASDGAVADDDVASDVVASDVAAPDGVASGRAIGLVRQRWAGLLLEEAVLDAPVALLTVAIDAVSAAPAEVPGAVVVHHVSPSLAEGDLVVRAAETPAGTGGASLASARVVVGGGRGVGSADGFGPLEELASLLGGVVGVSRVVTSEGWRPHSQQVGQTGTKITPELYLACGISGAIQHIAGCSGAKHIIAINTDPAAPMMARADYAVIGDLHQVIPALIEALRAR
jgi:electron transfer flavoprotein alpha subunit